MGLADRLRSHAIRYRALTRMLPHLPEIRQGGHSNAALVLARNRVRYGERLAIAYRDERHTWADVDARANQWARFYLSRGVAHGDVVALVMDNRPEYLFALLGASKVRAVTACVSTQLSGEALAHALKTAGPRLVVAGSEHEAEARDALSRLMHDGISPPIVITQDREGPASPSCVDEELAGRETKDIPGLSPLTAEPMAYLYTSGTTGLPKAAIVTNQRFLAAAYAFGNLMHQSGPGDVIYVPLPLYHGTGQWGGFGAALATGAAVALRRKFSATKFWEDAVRFEATHFMYIGELCRYLVHQPEVPEERVHGIRVAVGNGLRPDVWGPFQARFRIPTIREFYGATEGNAPLANLEGRPGMIGQLGMGQAVLRADLTTGAVLRNAKGRGEKVKSPGETGLLVAKITRLSTYDGYVDAAASEKKILRDVLSRGDTWFDTGDLVTLHEDDWLSFADRVGDTFRWKGENVSTTEVAGFLGACTGVLESNVYGVRVPGADGRAGMASLHVSSEFDVGRFGTEVDERLPAHARPLFLRLVRDLRRTATLKQQKVEYRDEGFDPTVISDPLFARIGGRYVPLDEALHARLVSGRVAAG